MSESPSHRPHEHPPAPPNPRLAPSSPRRCRAASLLRALVTSKSSVAAETMSQAVDDAAAAASQLLAASAPSLPPSVLSRLKGALSPVLRPVRLGLLRRTRASRDAAADAAVLGAAVGAAGVLSASSDLLLGAAPGVARKAVAVARMMAGQTSVHLGGKKRGPNSQRRAVAVWSAREAGYVLLGAAWAAGDACPDVSMLGDALGPHALSQLEELLQSGTSDTVLW